MKKIACVFLFLCMVLGMSGCDTQSNKDSINVEEGYFNIKLDVAKEYINFAVDSEFIPEKYIVDSYTVDSTELLIKWTYYITDSVSVVFTADADTEYVYRICVFHMPTYSDTLVFDDTCLKLIKAFVTDVDESTIKTMSESQEEGPQTYIIDNIEITYDKGDGGSIFNMVVA